jgi:hypothetical protein
MRVNVGVFDCLVKAASRHGITDVVWAEGAGISQPAISHLRLTSKILHGNPRAEVDRPVTIDKIETLYNGLRTLKGEQIVADVKDCIKSETNIDVKLQLLLLLLRSKTDDVKKQAVSMLEILSQTPSKK